MAMVDAVTEVDEWLLQFKATPITLPPVVNRMNLPRDLFWRLIDARAADWRGRACRRCNDTFMEGGTVNYIVDLDRPRWLDLCPECNHWMRRGMTIDPRGVGL